MDRELRIELAARIDRLSGPGHSMLLGYLVGKFIDNPNANFWMMLHRALDELILPVETKVEKS